MRKYVEAALSFADHARPAQFDRLQVVDDHTRPRLFRSRRSLHSGLQTSTAYPQARFQRSPTAGNKGRLVLLQAVAFLCVRWCNLVFFARQLHPQRLDPNVRAGHQLYARWCLSRCSNECRLHCRTHPSWNHDGPDASSICDWFLLLWQRPLLPCAVGLCRPLEWDASSLRHHVWCVSQLLSLSLRSSLTDLLLATGLLGLSFSAVWTKLITVISSTSAALPRCWIRVDSSTSLRYRREQPQPSAAHLFPVCPCSRLRQHLLYVSPDLIAPFAAT